jgi:hypothetical protein
MTPVLQRLALAVALVLLVPMGAATAAEPMGPSSTSAAGFTAVAPANALEARVDAAFLAAFPVYEMARARYNAVVNPLNPQPLPPNGAPVNRRTLIDHTARDVTTPNNDTLYSASWLDLRATPVRLQVPRVDGGRYWSIALLDIWTDNFAVLGRGTLGEGPLDVVVVGPDWQGPTPAGVRVVRATSNDVQLVGRFLVNGRDDLPAVHRLQDGIRIAPVAPGVRDEPQWVAVTRSTDPANFLAVVNEMLWRNPPAGARAARFEGWRDLGFGGGADAFARVAPDVRKAWEARLPVLHEALKVGLSYGARSIGPWRVPSPAVGNFGDDDLLRATVAFGGLSALTSTEAIYLSLDTDPQGRPLDGGRSWILDVPPLDVKGFWSLSMYTKDADGRLFFAENPIGRYSIGDRTAGIVKDANGHVKVLLQHASPADTRNWLPAPAGAYGIVLRAYVPSEALREGRAPLPRLTPAK